jgi:transglutaminase-like putative cysteine protease
MRLHVSHRSTYVYQPAAARVSLRLKLFPSIYDGQNTESWVVTVNGEVVKPIYLSGYGDDIALWQSVDPVETAVVLAEGVVIVDDKAGVVRDLPRKPPSAIFRRSTELTGPSETIAKLADTARMEDQLETVHALSSAVREAMKFRPNTTDSKTTAAEALAQGTGVCQDYSHIFISACRSVGIPARYVTGYLQADDDETAQLETHAWAEAHIRNFGWIGVDPSNGVSPTDHYVRIACGLDADDATPIKGHVVGGSEISLTAQVVVADSQQQ